MGSIWASYKKSILNRMDKHWAGGHKATNCYRQLLASIIQPGMTLLHAGCGRDKLNISAPYRETCQVIGIDLDSHMEKKFHSEFHLASLDDMPFADESFDVVISEYVMEHVRNADRVFKEIERVIKPGGEIIILTPNLWSYKSLIARLTPFAFHMYMGRIRYGTVYENDFYPTHYHSNTKKKIEELAKATRLQVVEIDYINNGPTWFLKFPLLFDLAYMFHRALDVFPFLSWMKCALLVRIRKT